jgi:hypothetical protein
VKTEREAKGLKKGGRWSSSYEVLPCSTEIKSEDISITPPEKLVEP